MCGRKGGDPAVAGRPDGKYHDSASALFAQDCMLCVWVFWSFGVYGLEILMAMHLAHVLLKINCDLSRSACERSEF